MRSNSWLYCAAIFGGFWLSQTPVFGQENWEFPPIHREVALVAHDQPIQPPPDDGLVIPSDKLPDVPGGRRPWLVEDPSPGVPPTCATKDEALAAPNCGTDDVQYVCCPPTWVVRAEALYWTRTAGGTQVLANAPGAALNVNQLDPNWAAGPRLTLQRNDLFGTCWDLELIYFGIDGFQSTGALAGATSLGTTPAINFGPLDVNVLYTSRIYNAEANLRRELTDRWTFVNGFRWFRLREDLNSDIGGIASTSVTTTNDLYGYQAGFDYRIWNYSNRLFLDGFAKAGIYGASADQTTTTVGVGGALPLITATRSQVAFLGETGIYGGWRITDSLRLIGGYNVLFLSGVATAPGQLASTNIATGVATVDMNNSPIFHGGTVGLEWAR